MGRLKTNHHPPRTAGRAVGAGGAAPRRGGPDAPAIGDSIAGMDSTPGVRVCGRRRRVVAGGIARTTSRKGRRRCGAPLPQRHEHHPQGLLGPTRISPYQRLTGFALVRRIGTAAKNGLDVKGVFICPNRQGCDRRSGADPIRHLDSRAVGTPWQPRS